MTTLNYISMSLDIFCAAISLTIFYSLLLDSDKRLKMNRLFRMFVVCNIGIVSSDVVAWLMTGNTERYAYYLIRAANFLHYAFGPLLLVSMTIYMLTYIELKVKVPGRIKLVCLFLCALSLLLTVVSQFTGMYYIIDENNVYHRQELFWLSQTLPAIGLLINIGIVFAYRRVLERRAALFFLTYMVMPVIALVIQILFYGITVINISTTLIILILYIFVQTEQVRNKEMMEQRLAEENAALERVNRLRAEMIATISHEARTPLAVLASYASLVSLEMQEKYTDPQMISDLDKIAFEAKRVAGLIDRMKNLPIRKERAAKRVTFDLGGLVKQTAELYLHILDRAGVTLVTDIADDLPPMFGNPEELTQVIFNLLQNAKNHTASGSVTVTLKVEGNGFAVSVADTGEGVSPELLPYVFEHGTHGGEGTGIGLAVCREIISAHGGDISIESEQGKGTAVIITLPIYHGGDTDGRQ